MRFDAKRECDVDLDKLRLSTDPAFRTRLPFTLRKHAYSIILKILPPKNETFQKKNLFFIFLLKAQIVVLVLDEAVLTSTQNLCFEQK